MRRLYTSSIIIFTLILITITSVFALDSGILGHDSFVRITDPDQNFNTEDLSAAGSTTNCNPTDTIYLQWDLSSISDEDVYNAATLVLTTTYTGNTDDAFMALYSTSDGWTEEPLTQNNASPLGTFLETRDAPLNTGERITFSSINLLDYLTEQMNGDDLASFVILFDSGCVAGVSLAIFEDKESPADHPTLTLVKTSALVYSENTRVVIGESSEISLMSTGMDDIYGIELTVEYSPTMITVLDSNSSLPGIQINPGTCPQPDLVAQNLVDTTNGIISYAVTQLSPTPPCSGGDIANIEFVCSVVGLSSVKITESKVSDINGEPIIHGVHSGEINCTYENVYFFPLVYSSE